MSDAPAWVGELRSDFAERNTALFMLLGFLSLSDRLTRTVAMDAKHAHPSPAARVEYFALGLIAIAEQVKSLAARFREDAVPPPPEPPPTPEMHLRLMR